MRLKVNEGTYKTPCKFNVSESCTVPIWVTKVCSPFGKDTKVFMVEVIVVKRDTECTIWFVALVSIIHSEVLCACLSTMWVEKIECVKEGAD